MNGLYTLDGEMLSRIVKRTSVFKYESNLIKNRLLDGTYHVQIIGEPTINIDFEIYSDGNNSKEINRLQAIGTIFDLIIDDEVYRGFIDSQINWDPMITKRSNEKMWYLGSSKFILIGG